MLVNEKLTEWMIFFKFPDKFQNINELGDI